MKTLSRALKLMTCSACLFMGCSDKSSPIIPPAAQSISSEDLAVGLAGKGVKSHFFDDFERGLSAWTGKSGINGNYVETHHGIIVKDPLRRRNQVLTFSAQNSDGDIFSPGVRINPGQKGVLTFDYLGIPSGAGLTELGGVIGIANENNEIFHVAALNLDLYPFIQVRGLAGTTYGPLQPGDPRDRYGIESNMLIADGKWHSYRIVIDPYRAGYWYNSPKNNVIHMFLEDWAGAIGGNSYFDNVRIEFTGECGERHDVDDRR